jgi:chromatin remodeling complex protein RSC6
MAKTTKSVTQEPIATAPVVVAAVEKKVKAPKKEKAVAEVAAPVVDVAPVVVAAVEKKVKAPKKEKAVAEVAAPVVVAASASDAPVVAASDAPVAAEKDTQDSVNIDTIVAKVKTFMALGGEILRDVRTLEKSHSRELKAAQKAAQKKKRKTSSSDSAGFKKLREITDAFCDFLDKPHGSLMSNREATRTVNDYIKTHDLQNQGTLPGGRRVILADGKLAKLFEISEKEVSEGKLSYFNLQCYLAKLFKPSAAATVAATA